MLTEKGWPRYFEVEYKFRSGDKIPVELVGKQENESALKLVLQETGGGDLVLKGQGSPLSFRAGELWLLPSLDSVTGDCLVFKRKLEVESDGDAPPRFLTVLTTLSVTLSTLSNPVPGKPPNCHSILELREYMSGADCVARTRRVYTRQTFFGKDDPDRIAGVKDVASAEAVGLLHTYLRQDWTEVLSNGTVTTAAGSVLQDGGLDADAAELVPRWLMEPAAQRRCKVQQSRQGGRDALQLVVEAQVDGSAEWEVVETLTAALGSSEFWVSGALTTESGDALVLSRGVWQLHMWHQDCAILVELRINRIVEGMMKSVSVSWKEPVIGAVEGRARGRAGLVRTASQSKSFSDHLISSRWAEYLERPRMFKSGDEIPDEMACGGDAKTCIMTGLALGMTVPVPGFALIGGLGGAVVATPPVQRAVARYVGDSLAHRIVVCEGEFGDFHLSCEFNHVGESWKQADVYSFKAGEFELQPCTNSLNGEQLHVVHRCESQGAVLVVHDYHSVERLGRGINVRQEVFDGDRMVCSSQRYYEYVEGSVMQREVLQPFIPSETMVATQLEWIETNVDDWLATHQDEVMAEAKHLAIKAQENEELMGHGEALAAMAEAAVEKSAAFAEAKQKHESLRANQRINAAELLALGTKVASEMAVNVSVMEEGQRRAALESATVVVEEVSTLAQQSDGIQKLVREGESAIDAQSIAPSADRATWVQSDAQVSKLLADGEQIAADIATREINTPEDVLALLEENEEFVQQLIDLALTYIEQVVCSVEIPAIVGDKEWGTYKIAGLAIKRFSIDPECVQAIVTECVRIDVRGIAIEFDAFSFELDKTTFPAVKDKGKAEATATISACVQFGISTDAEKNIAIDNLEAHVQVDTLPVAVITANHKWLFNTLLSFFASRVKDAVQEEVVEQVEQGVAYLDEQLGAALSRIIDTFASKGGELLHVTGNAVDVSVLLRIVLPHHAPA